MNILDGGLTTEVQAEVLLPKSLRGCGTGLLPPHTPRAQGRFSAHVVLSASQVAGMPSPGASPAAWAALFRDVL